MPFSNKCLEYRGATIVVKPLHAYGWSRMPKIEGQFDYKPEPFMLRIEDFLIWQDAVAALQGVVKQPGHKFDGYWVTAVPRMDDRIIDFDKAIGPCGLVVSPQKSVFDANLVPANHPDAVQSRGEPSFRGHGVLEIQNEVKL